MTLNSQDIEIAVAAYFGPRRHIIVPNVSWGMFSYELDMVVLSKSGYAYEIEIKISKSDLIRDQKKLHDHRNNLIRLLYFAVPSELGDACINYAPERAGIITIKDNSRYSVNTLRMPQTNKLARKLTEAEQLNLARLGTMRIWNLKRNLRDTLRQLRLEHGRAGEDDR